MLGYENPSLDRRHWVGSAVLRANQSATLRLYWVWRAFPSNKKGYQTMTRQGLVLAFLVPFLTSQIAWALNDGDKEGVRQLANEAAHEFDQGQFESARVKFMRAYAIAKVPRLALRAAQAHERLGKLVAAYELYRQAIGLVKTDLWTGSTQEDAQAQAREELAALQPRIPRLVIAVERAGNAGPLSLTLDGVAIPNELVGVSRYVDPGERVVHGQLGQAEAEERVTLVEGEQKQVVLKFGESAKPAAASANSATTKPRTENAPSDNVPAGNTQRFLGWTSLGIGAAGVVVGGTAGLFALRSYGQLKDLCADRQCGSEQAGKVSGYDHWRLASTIGFVVGGVASAAGVTLLLTSPKAERSALSLWFLPDSAGVKGAF
jgi:hypothetical protein